MSWTFGIGWMVWFMIISVSPWLSCPFIMIEINGRFISLELELARVLAVLDDDDDEMRICSFSSKTGTRRADVASRKESRPKTARERRI